MVRSGTIPEIHRAVCESNLKQPRAPPSQKKKKKKDLDLGWLATKDIRLGFG
jgi:hypothetical protein